MDFMNWRKTFGIFAICLALGPCDFIYANTKVPAKDVTITDLNTGPCDNILNVQDCLAILNATGPGTAVWGSITGTLSNQTDLQAALDAKVPKVTTVNSHALTSNVVVTKSDIGLGSVENTALSTWGGSANLATLGTITLGTWNGTAIDLASYVSGNLGIGHFNSGTGASASTFWRGDGTWGTPTDTGITGLTGDTGGTTTGTTVAIAGGTFMTTARSSNTISASLNTSSMGTAITYGNGGVDSFQWTFSMPTDIRTDNPYFKFVKDRGTNGNGFTYMELRPGAHDLRVMDDVMMLDTTPNLRWYDITHDSQDYEVQVKDNDFVMKRVGDITACPNLNYTPGCYQTQEWIHFYGSTDDHVTGDILQVGVDSNFISFGETANPSTFFQFTRNADNTSDLVDSTSWNIRSKGAVAAGFGNRTLYSLEDDSGSTGISAAADVVDWTSAVHGSASAERTWYNRQNNSLIQGFSIDGSGNGIWGTHSTATARFHVMASGAYDAAPQTLLNLESRTTGTSAAGHGVDLLLSGQDSDGTHNISLVKIEGLYHDGGAGAQNGEYRLQVKNAGSMVLQEVIDESLKHGWGEVTNPSSKFDFVNQTSGTNDVADSMSFERKSTGTSASGIGMRNIDKIQDDAGNAVNARAITTKLTTVTSGAASASIQEFTQQSGSLTGVRYINPSGWTVIGSGTSTNGFFDIHKPDGTGLSAEAPEFYVTNTSQGLADGTSITNWRNIFLTAPTLNGVAGGGTETITNASTVYIDAAPSGSNITITNPWSLNINSGATRLNGAVNLPTLTASLCLALDSSKNITTVSCSSGSGTITAVGDITSGDAGTASLPVSYLYFKNVTSGSIKLQTVAGALGSPTLSLPAETGTICSTGSVCSGYQASGTYTNTVSNSDGTLTISPTSGSVVASIALGHANTWTGAQKFNELDFAANSPTQITSDQNDYAPSSNSVLRLNSDATRNITGFGSPTSGRIVRIINVGSFNIVLNNQNTGSSSANRIATATGSDITILPGQTANLIYDGTTTRWRDTAMQSGILSAVNFPALTGDITTTAGALATTLATVNSNTGSFGSSTSIPTFTVNGKGLITAASGNAVIAPAGTLTGTTLASNVVTSSLTSVGIISSGTWHGTAIDLASYVTGILPSTSFPALTGDVTTSSGSVATTIGANKVTLGNLATLAANSAIANSTGSTATPTAVSMLNTATASSIALRDSNANLLANNFLQSYTTTATAAGTTTLTVGSTQTQFFTGSTTQTVVLPVVSTLALNHQFKIVNNSTGAVTVQSSGGNTIVILSGSTIGSFTCILTSGTGTASWNYSYLADIVASGKTLNVSNSLTLAGTDGVTMTTPTTSFTAARTDAANTFTGHQTIEGVTTAGATGTTNLVFSNSPTLVTPALGVASATSLATSAATPFLLTNGQLVNIALTSQTSGATTLTIPDFAGVVDEFTFKTKSQTLSNKTFVAPVLGAATATTINKLTLTQPSTGATLTLADNSSLITSGAFATTFTVTGTTGVTLPTTGTLATLAGTETFTNKRVTPRVVTASDATSVTPNTDNADVTYQANTQSTGTLTINADSGTPTNGQKWIFKIKSTNVQTFSWNAVFNGSTDVALPTASTGSSKYDYVGFIYNSANSKWDCVAVTKGFS